MLKYIILLIFSVLFFKSSAKRYEYMSYNQILDKMKELPQKYSRYCKLIDVRQEYSPIIDTNCGDTKCEHWYLELTDFNLPAEQINALPQVLYIGSIHGDEPLGTNIVINFAEYLLQKAESDKFISNLISSRLIILLPLANPSGFYSNKKEEIQPSNMIIDSGLDFPYNIKDSQCLRTTTARVINHLFKKYLIQAALAFQGDQQIISYPWGSPNHIQTTGEGQKNIDQSPDNKIFSDVAHIMSKEAGSNLMLFIKQYPTGEISEITGGFSGGIGDWAYSGSWETAFSPDIISKCDNPSQVVPLSPSETEYDSQSLRTLIFVAQPSNLKAPSSAYLGTSEGLDMNQDTYAYGYGYITMNIKTCLVLADIIAPYVKLNSIDYSNEKKTLIIEWQAGGCKNVDETSLEWVNKGGDPNQPNKSSPKQGFGYYQNHNFVFQEVISMEDPDFSIDFKIKLTCDQEWGIQNDPDSSTGPQTHVAQARLNQEYSVESNGYKVTGKKIVELNMKNINQQYIIKTRTPDAKSLSLKIDFLECSSFNNLGTIYTQTINNKDDVVLSFSGKLKITDATLEGHLHEYADVSRCQELVGGPLNVMTLMSDTNLEKSLLFPVESDGNMGTIKVEYQLPLKNEQNILNMIGRSVILENRDHSGKAYVGQITLLQPDSCNKGDEMNDCIGIDLGLRQGVCLVKVPLQDSITNFKLIIQPNTQNRTVRIQGFVPNAVLNRYKQFSEISIMAENSEKIFHVNKQLSPDFGVIEADIFDLDPQIALGTPLRIYASSAGLKTPLGGCYIGLKDPNFNEADSLPASIVTTETESNKLWIFIVASVFVLLLSIAAALCFYFRKKNKTARNNDLKKLNPSGTPETLDKLDAPQSESEGPRIGFPNAGALGEIGKRRDHIVLPEDEDD